MGLLAQLIAIAVLRANIAQKVPLLVIYVLPVCIIRALDLVRVSLVATVNTVLLVQLAAIHVRQVNSPHLRLWALAAFVLLVNLVSISTFQVVPFALRVNQVFPDRARVLYALWVSTIRRRLPEVALSALLANILVVLIP